jgi:hypothetical protein
MKIGDELKEITEDDFNIFDKKNIINAEIDQFKVYILNITKEIKLKS